MTRNEYVILDFQLMRCIAKIAEVVYPKLESRQLAPLTPRRRIRSISTRNDSPSPVPDLDNEDSNNSTGFDGSTNVKEIESDEEIVEGHSSHGDPRKEMQNSTYVPQLQFVVGCGDNGNSPARTPESRTMPRHSAAHSEGGKHASAMTKMLFEILQNLLADILTILEKVRRRSLYIGAVLAFPHFFCVLGIG